MIKKLAVKKFIPIFSKWKLAKMIASSQKTGGGGKMQKPVFFLSLLLSRWRNAPMTLLLSWIGLKLSNQNVKSTAGKLKDKATGAENPLNKGNLARFGYTGALVWLTAKFLGKRSLPGLLMTYVLGMLWKTKPVKRLLQPA